MAFSVKLFLALTTTGSLDVLGFSDQLARIRELGGIGTYHTTGKFGNPFNHPPFMIHVIKAMGFLADRTGIAFPFWLRLPAIVADVGSLLVVWKILERSELFPLKPPTLLLMAACPASIMISGFHGNTDPLMILFLLLSVYLLGTKNRIWVAGIAFGMALNIKVAPLIFVPINFFYLDTMKQRIKFFAAAVAVFLAGSMPYLLQDPQVIARVVFGYGSLYGNWGWTWLALLWTHIPATAPGSPYQLTGIHATIATVGKYLMLAIIYFVSWRINRREIRPPLFFQYGAIAFLFMFLTPGFGSQYLAWLIPWVLVLGFWPTMLYYTTSGIYLLIDYGCLAYAFAHYPICEDKRLWFYAGLICWYSVLAVLMFYRGSIKGLRGSCESALPPTSHSAVGKG
jgi:hypothetical protein